MRRKIRPRVYTAEQIAKDRKESIQSGWGEALDEIERLQADNARLRACFVSLVKYVSALVEKEGAK